MSELGWKFARFCLVGAVASALQFAILIGGVRLFGVDPVTASSAGYVTWRRTRTPPASQSDC